MRAQAADIFFQDQVAYEWRSDDPQLPSTSKTPHPWSGPATLSTAQSLPRNVVSLKYNLDNDTLRIIKKFLIQVSGLLWMALINTQYRLRSHELPKHIAKLFFFSCNFLAGKYINTTLVKQSRNVVNVYAANTHGTLHPPAFVNGCKMHTATTSTTNNNNKKLKEGIDTSM